MRQPQTLHFDEVADIFKEPLNNCILSKECGGECEALCAQLQNGQVFHV